MPPQISSYPLFTPSLHTLSSYTLFTLPRLQVQRIGIWPVGTTLSLSVAFNGWAKGTAVVVKPSAAEPNASDSASVRVQPVHPLTNAPIVLADAEGALAAPFYAPCDVLQLRMGANNLANEHLFRAGRLLQQYIATQAARSDVWRMNWIRSPTGQKQLRAEEYGTLRSAVADGANL